jgi:hypothetical protein
VVAYALVCTRPDDHARHVRRATARLASALAHDAVRGRLDASSRAFFRQRIRDAAALTHSVRTPPAPAHAHLNVADTGRSGRAALTLRDHIDARVTASGLDSWFAEINAEEGSRAAALQRIGFVIVDRQPNHTLTWLCERPVERLTVVRELRPGR